jgi:hypothetical protein
MLFLLYHIHLQYRQFDQGNCQLIYAWNCAHNVHQYSSSVNYETVMLLASRCHKKPGHAMKQYFFTTLHTDGIKPHFK